MSENRIPAARFRQVGECVYELGTDWRADMRVPVRVFADEVLFEGILSGDAITQLVNVATLPGVVTAACGMPDMHDGYGFPVGGVAATAMPGGVVSPGGVGFDINCGVRLLALPLRFAALRDHLESFVHELSRSVPTGTGRGGRTILDDQELDAILAGGSAHLARVLGIGSDDDVRHTESGGCLPGADPTKVSIRAKQRGRGQLGSLGAGNHFLEVQRVERIADATAASAFGLEPDQVAVLIHTGSRGLGHQVCTDYVQVMDARAAHHGIVLPDRQLSCAPADSEEGRAYLAAMAAAGNFAWANRHTLGQVVRDVTVRLFGCAAADIRTVYDVAHNVAKTETHGGATVCVHRKGATRAFGPGHSELPPAYRGVGQPVFIPGSMGTGSWVLAGLATSAERSWSSACHGAGRVLSRGAAKRLVTGAALRRELEAKGIVVRCPSSAGLAEEAPAAYKDVDRVAEVVERAGLAKRVVRLAPLGVIKG